MKWNPKMFEAGLYREIWINKNNFLCVIQTTELTKTFIPALYIMEELQCKYIIAVSLAEGSVETGD